MSAERDPNVNPDSDSINRGSAPPTPRWVKAFAVGFVLVVVVMVVMLATGHGPGSHMKL